MKTLELVLPVHWASSLVNSDDSGLSDADIKAIDKFINGMVDEYGQCYCIDVSEDSDFLKYHDAMEYGVLACDCATFTFDITPE